MESPALIHMSDPALQSRRHGAFSDSHLCVTAARLGVERPDPFPRACVTGEMGWSPLAGAYGPCSDLRPGHPATRSAALSPPTPQSSSWAGPRGLRLEDSHN